MIQVISLCSYLSIFILNDTMKFVVIWKTLRLRKLSHRHYSVVVRMQHSSSFLRGIRICCNGMKYSIPLQKPKGIFPVRVFCGGVWQPPRYKRSPLLKFSTTLPTFSKWTHSTAFVRTNITRMRVPQTP